MFIKNILNNKKILLWTNIITIIVLLFLGFLFFENNKDLNNVTKILRDQDDDFILTSPILDCENFSQISSPIISSNKIKDELNEIKEKYQVEDISLYYRDLNNGPWIGINEDSLFSPASLLKTPVAMALFKYSEDNEEILNKKIIVSNEDILLDKNQNIKFDGVIEGGKEYTFLQILESMLQKSDNAAAGIILRNVPEKYTDGVFHSIGVPYKDVRHEVSLRVKDYAAFFRVLFNASYLNRPMSEKLLEILSNTEYKDGLVKGVPSNIKVAHKFGERVINNVYQLHDCGIVYYPKNPYLLCVMTKGNNFTNQQRVISELSDFIYKEVDKNIKDDY